MSPKRHRIGYAFTRQKAEFFFQPSLLSHTARHNIEFVAIDPSVPLAQQGPFDCITHKLYDSDWVSNLSNFSSQNPKIPIIDPHSAISTLQDRNSMLNLIQNLKVPNLHVPKQQLVTTVSDKAKALLILRFPIIAKPAVATGTATSHKMCMIYDQEGLEELDAELGYVLQEFVNHGGVLCKVYVAGDYVQCEKRQSLPDVPAAGKAAGGLKGLVGMSRVSSMMVERDDVAMPEVGFVEMVAKGMREELGIRLFNFDLIRDRSDENRFLIIDINYFPGFEKLPNYESLMTKFFLDVLKVKEKGREEEDETEDDGSTSCMKLVQRLSLCSIM